MMISNVTIHRAKRITATAYESHLADPIHWVSVVIHGADGETFELSIFFNNALATQAYANGINSASEALDLEEV
jgi:hypothetical protein